MLPNHAKFFVSFSLIVLSMLVHASAPLSEPAANKFRMELENESAINPSGSKFITDHSTEVFFSYETELLEFGTTTEFDLEGLTEEEILFGIDGNPIDGALELEFDTETAELETYGITGDVLITPDSTLSLEYESDYSSEGSEDSELTFTYSRGINKAGSIEAEGTFEESWSKCNPAPSETTIDVSGLEVGKFSVDVELEFTGPDPESAELDYEGPGTAFRKSVPTMDGSLSWDFSEKCLNFEPELEFRLATIYLEAGIPVKKSKTVDSFDIKEAGIRDFDFAGWGVKVTNDFESDEAEVVLEKDKEQLESEFEFQLSPESQGTIFNFDRVTGELVWYPEEPLSVTLGSELTSSSIAQLSVGSEYSF